MRGIFGFPINSHRDRFFWENISPQGRRASSTRRLPEPKLPFLAQGVKSWKQIVPGCFFFVLISNMISYNESSVYSFTVRGTNGQCS